MTSQDSMYVGMLSCSALRRAFAPVAFSAAKQCCTLRPVVRRFPQAQDVHGLLAELSGIMDPLLMVDHFRMMEPTFGPHRHAGFSALTYVFEDSRSPHLNSDSLGNDLSIHPGAFHWMVAGRGVEHGEWPGGENPEVQGLQIFVNLPVHKRNIDPYAVHIEPKNVPEYRTPDVRIRVVAGELGGSRSPAQLPQPFSFFDAFLAAGACTDLPAQASWDAWLYVLDGSIQIKVDNESVVLNKGFLIAMGQFDEASSLRVTSFA